MRKWSGGAPASPGPGVLLARGSAPAATAAPSCRSASSFRGNMLFQGLAFFVLLCSCPLYVVFCVATPFWRESECMSPVRDKMTHRAAPPWHLGDDGHTRATTATARLVGTSHDWREARRPVPAPKPRADPVALPDAASSFNALTVVAGGWEPDTRPGRGLAGAA